MGNETLHLDLWEIELYHEEFINRLKKIVRERDSITITGGIRPYGIHPGNYLSIITVPKLLVETITKELPDIKLTYSFGYDDLEPMKYDSVNWIIKEPTFKFAEKVFDYPLNKIENEINGLVKENLSDYFEVIEFSNFSDSLKKHEDIFNYLFSKPEKELEIGKIFLQKPENKRIYGYTSIDLKIENEKVSYLSNIDNSWFLYTVLLALDLLIDDMEGATPDIIVFGNEYKKTPVNYKFTSYLSALNIAKNLGLKKTPSIIIYTPLLLGRDGKKMSKSLNNIEWVDERKLEYVVKEIITGHKKKDYIQISEVL